MKCQPETSKLEVVQNRGKMVYVVFRCPLGLIQFLPAKQGSGEKQCIFVWMMISSQIVIIKNSDLENGVVSTQTQVENGNDACNFNGKIVSVSWK